MALDAEARGMRTWGWIAERLAAELVPRALGDAGATAAWRADEATWEAARRRLLELASCQSPSPP